MPALDETHSTTKTPIAYPEDLIAVDGETIRIQCFASIGEFYRSGYCHSYNTCSRWFEDLATGDKIIQHGYYDDNRYSRDRDGKEFKRTPTAQRHRAD